jgi:hypothetical protein
MYTWLAAIKAAAAWLGGHLGVRQWPDGRQLPQLLQELLCLRLCTVDELCRKRQCCAKHQPYRGDGTVFLRCRPQAKKYPRKMVWPVERLLL